MRVFVTFGVVVLLLAGAWFIKDSAVFTSRYQAPPHGAPATVGTWVNIGPAPLSYIDNPGDPANFNSGRVAALAVDPRNLNHWLVGVGNGGVWETFDSGTSWLPITDSAPTLATGAVTFAPSDPQIIYVGTGEAPGGVGFVQVGVGILKSIDGGRTWSVLAAPTFARGSVRRIRVHPTNVNVLLTATSRGGFGKDSREGAPSPPLFGIHKSLDGGVSWTRTLAGQASSLEVDETNFNNQYAAIADQREGRPGEAGGNVVNGLYRSTNGGDTWTRVDGPWGVSTLSLPTIGRVELALSPSSPNVLYASIQIPPRGGTSGNGLLGLWRTDDAWAPVPTWVQVPTQPTGTGGYCDPKCGYTHAIIVDPSNPNSLYVGGAEKGFWRCSNCGTSPSWTNIVTSARVHSDLHAFAYAGSRLILGNDGGVWSTTNGGQSWHNHNYGLPTAMFYSGALHPTDRQVMIGGLRDFQSIVAGPNNQWSILQQVASWEWGEAEVAMSASNPKHWMLAWIFGAISRTTDGGVTGSQVETGLDKTGAAFVAPVRKCPTNDDVFLTGTNRMWRTNSFFSAATPVWTQNGPTHPYPFPNTLDAPGTIHAIAFAPTEAGCNTYAYGNRGGEINLTRDGGVTWTNLDPNRTLPARPINSIVFHPATAATAYAAISSFNDATPTRPGHVFKTVNALAATPTWVAVSPAADVPFNVLAIDPRNPNLIYAGSDRGLWQSNDGGATWAKQGLEVGMPNTSVFDLQINPVTDTTIAFTHGRGAYRLVTAATSVHPPTDLRVVSVVGSNVTMSFKAPTDSLSPTGYVLEGGTTPGQVLGTLPVGASATTFTFQAPTGAFYVRLHTLAASLRSAASNEVRLFVNVPAKPGPPTNLLFVVDGSTLSLAWMNSASGGVPTRMELIARPVGGTNTAFPIPVGESTTFPSVPPGTYILAIAAGNASGFGDSNVVFATVPGPCTGIPGPPANLTATKTGNLITLRWDLPPSGPAPTSFIVNVTGAYVGSFPVTARTLSGSVGPGAYTITVSSRNSCGVSAPTAPQTVVVP